MRTRLLLVMVGTAGLLLLAAVLVFFLVGLGSNKPDAGGNNADDKTPAPTNLDGRKFVHFGPAGPRVLVESNEVLSKPNRFECWILDPIADRVVAGPLKHEAIFSAAFSEDGRRVVTGCLDMRVRVWDSETGKLLAGPLANDEARPHVALLHPALNSDGRKVIFRSQGGTALVCEADTGKIVAGPFRHEPALLRGVEHVCFSPDGRYAVTASKNQTAWVWDVDTGARVAGPLQHAFIVEHASFSADSRAVVTVGGDAKIWNVSSGKLIAGPLQHEVMVKQASFSPDGTRVLTAGGREANVWDADTGKRIAGPLQHAGYLQDAAFSPNGKQIAVACGHDRTVSVWDVETGRRSIQTDKVTDLQRLAFSPDGKQIVIASTDSAKVLDAANGKVTTNSRRPN